MAESQMPDNWLVSNAQSQEGRAHIFVCIPSRPLSFHNDSNENIPIEIWIIHTWEKSAKGIWEHDAADVTFWLTRHILTCIRQMNQQWYDVTWQKARRFLFNLPLRAHSKILHFICNDLCILQNDWSQREFNHSSTCMSWSDSIWKLLPSLWQTDNKHMMTDKMKVMRHWIRQANLWATK